MAVGIATGLFFGLLLSIELGYRWGRAGLRRDGEEVRKGLGPLESAVFALLGLILAFNLGGALNRFERRRDLIVDEANAMGTAWLRLDLLPPEAQPAVRDLFRRYVDSRIATYAALPDLEAAGAEVVRSSDLQAQIWKHSVEATRPAEASRLAEVVPARVILMPALNEMFDLATTRNRAAYVHTPPMLTAYLLSIALLTGALAGHAVSWGKRRPLSYCLVFALILSATVYVIIDIDYPRFGLIRVDSADQAIFDARAAMR